jgi:penicillin-binding protein 1A
VRSYNHFGFFWKFMSASDRPMGPFSRLIGGMPPWAQTLTRIAAWGFGLAGAAAFTVLLLVGLALAVAYPNLPEIKGLVDYQPKLPMRIYSADDVLLGEFGEERRNFVSVKDMPKVMKDAVLAIEDARFYEHGGVDYKGVIRAGLANFGDAGRSQGASTITMQVARNFYLSTEKTFTRKIYEILLALKIETQLNKDQILEVYMNQIYLGQRAYGFSSAAEIYFGKTLKDLTVAEAAMLAGLPKAPSAYNPIVNPNRARLRQQYIIDRMLDNGFITPQQHDAAKAQKLVYRAPAEVPVHAEYVAELARQMIFSQYGDEAYTRGLNVHLTVNSADQMAAYRSLRKGVMDFERRQVYRGPEAYVDLPQDPKEIDARVAEALGDHPDNDEIRAGVVLEAGPRKVVAVLQNGESITITGEGLKPATSGLAAKANPKTQIRPGAVIRLVRVGPKNEWSITQLPEVEGCFVALDPSTGAMRAMVGGFDYAKNKFNHVTQAWRQPGSSFKPFIYSAALEKGFTPATVVNDAPLFFDADVTGSQPWEPKNYDGTFDGPMSIRRGLAKSKNMISIRILQAITPQYAQEWASRFGFDPEKHPAYLTMALGAGSVTPLQMASAYGVFANGGYRIDPYLIASVTDTRGRMLTEAKPQKLDENTRVIDARNAFVMSSLLGEVTRSGTAARAQATLKRPDVYGKTGTTNDSLDAWFAGFQKSEVAVVWMGYDNPRKLGDRETGGGLALPVWIDYMLTSLKGVPVAEPSVPEGLVNLGGEWYYEEYTHGSGVSSLGLEDKLPVPPSEEEKKGILDLFRR